ncbi:fibrobacter succinogenes major paralogous domain-containing protein [Candidatus Sulfidibacterium hydrothermale]|uniref:fibrobacter succinogenes major paralogous domain-containing protein n=1 Tax=Candidatus Sulfidibacterium hydrothermale TaxID=2875962 RepID=UPI001F0B1622|nr:fibrobacter succinogenes major paralogous domain-containing protein [Candidatus Sulfidibacterium hydrothermale]UBM63193.1 fibrobacter succinogenes major paralogous domain-containing protein [Candidatus Sulfidibacterium hydrothermale]
MKKLLLIILVLGLFFASCEKKIPPVIEIQGIKQDTTNAIIEISVTGGNEEITEVGVNIGSQHGIATMKGDKWLAVVSDLKPNSLHQAKAYVTTSEEGTIYSDTALSFKTYAVIDYDGNGYYAVQIGDQLWLQSNLKVTHYRDGTPIPEVTDSLAWGKLTTGAYCSFQNDTAISNVYGLLYNWWAAFGKEHNLAPEGWRVANDTDWYQLWLYLGGDKSGGKIKEKGYNHWLEPNSGATNSTGFTALGAGMRWVVLDNNKSAPIVEKNVHLKNTNSTWKQWLNFKKVTMFWTDKWLPDINMYRIIIFANDDDNFHTTYGTQSNSGCSIRLIKE